MIADESFPEDLVADECDQPNNTMSTNLPTDASDFSPEPSSASSLEPEKSNASFDQKKIKPAADATFSKSCGPIYEGFTFETLEEVSKRVNLTDPGFGLADAFDTTFVDSGRFTNTTDAADLQFKYFQSDAMDNTIADTSSADGKSTSNDSLLETPSFNGSMSKLALIPPKAPTKKKKSYSCHDLNRGKADYSHVKSKVSYTI